jgi:hypothetical protein
MEPKLIATQPSHSPPSDYQGSAPSSTFDGSLPILVGFVIISTITISIYIFIPKRVQQHSFSLKYGPKTLCPHCRYFNRNPYLQCSVHPTTVMTKETLDCQDYSPNSQE